MEMRICLVVLNKVNKTCQTGWNYKQNKASDEHSRSSLKEAISSEQVLSLKCDARADRASFTSSGEDAELVSVGE